MTTREQHRRADLGARRVALDRAGRGPLARLARRRRADREPHVDELIAFAEVARSSSSTTVVLLGMGGSWLAPEVLRRAVRGESLPRPRHDAPARRSGGSSAALDLERTLFLVSSKSGATLETRSHLEFFWELTGGRGAQFAVITDPGSALEPLANERGFRAIFPGEPAIGGRYSALSMFGIVPAALMGVDVERLPAGARPRWRRGLPRRRTATRGSSSGLRLGEGWRQGRDKVCLDATPTGFGLWAEQLLAESTGKQGKGLVPAPGEPPDGPDRQRGEVAHRRAVRPRPASSSAGSSRPRSPVTCSGSTRSTSRTCRRRRTRRARCSRPASRTRARAARWTSCSRQARRRRLRRDPGLHRPGARAASCEPLARAGARDRLRRHARASGRATCTRPGQLHKGGPNTGLFVQVVDDTGDELPIPGATSASGA